MEKNTYKKIAEFSEYFREVTKIGNIFDFEPIIKEMGGTINIVSRENWEQGINPFLKIEGKNNFVVSLPIFFPVEVKKIIYGQVLGHYILHSNEGNTKLLIERMAKMDYKNQEALYFSLSILMPDKEFIDLYNKKLNDDTISKLFRVSKETIQMKRNILKKFELIQ